jgi:ATP-binding cassette subfamily C protein
VLSDKIGYLPQDSQLFAGTIAENIARFDLKIDPKAIVEVSRRVSAHDLITDLPLGYDTMLDVIDPQISAGLKQRIAIARTIIGDPRVMIFDEPCNDLDEDGMRAFQNIVRVAKSEGRCVVILTQSPAAVAECDMILSLKNGLQEAFGPKAAILRNGASSVTPIHNMAASRVTV